MNEPIGISLPTLVAQGLNLIFVLLLLSLPFILWNWWQKREKRMNERFDQLEEKIDSLSEK
jgi:preprotein translocase subunit YajC